MVCVHTLTPRENRERQESGIFTDQISGLWEYFKIFEKNTISNEHFYFYSGSATGRFAAMFTPRRQKREGSACLVDTERE